MDPSDTVGILDLIDKYLSLVGIRYYIASGLVFISGVVLIFLFLKLLNFLHGCHITWGNLTLRAPNKINEKYTASTADVGAKACPETVRPLQSMGALRCSIEELFKNIERTSNIFQTFVDVNTISPEQDYAGRLVNFDEDDRPTLTRIIQISSARDIYFAQWNIELTKKYGAKASLYIIPPQNDIHVASNQDKQHLVGCHSGAFPNFTISGNNVIVTYPNHFADIETEDDPLIEEDGSVVSRGYYIKNDEIAESSRLFLGVFTSLVKKRFTNPQKTLDLSKNILCLDQKKYLIAVSRAVSKEILLSSLLKNEVRYIGVVGSVVSMSSSYRPGDLDFVITFSDMNSSIYEEVVRIVNKILFNYSCDNLKLCPVFMANPLKVNDFSASVLPVQILVNTVKTMKQWSPFIAFQRKQNHISIFNRYEDFVGTTNFSVSDVVTETHGITTCLEALQSDSKGVPGKGWVIEGGVISYTRQYEKFHTGPSQLSSKANYAKYSVKWAFKNIVVAQDSFIPSRILDNSEKLDWLLSELNLLPSEKHVLHAIIYTEDAEDVSIEEIVSISVIFLANLKEYICKLSLV